MLSRSKEGQVEPSSVTSVTSAASISSKSKKKRSRPKKKKSGAVNDKNAPIVKIPSSKTEASNNWKLLLSQKSAEVSSRKQGLSKNISPFYAKDRFEGLKDKKHKMSSGTEGGEGGASSQQSTNKKSNEHGIIPPLTGLNALGCFDYTHYGHLKTLVGPEHKYLIEKTPALAIDCEMVGVGPLKENALARVSVVNEFGYCLYDKFVKPKANVTDYRTEFSGVREEDLKKAEEFKTVLAEIAELIKGHTLVGHSLKSDLDVLFLKHPKAKIRDTALYYRKRFKKGKTPSLKGLVKEYLGVHIQKGEHSSITDAQATMKIYLFIRDDWEESMSEKYNMRANRYWLAKEYRKAVQAVGGFKKHEIKPKH